MRSARHPLLIALLLSLAAVPAVAEPQPDPSLTVAAKAPAKAAFAAPARAEPFAAPARAEPVEIQRSVPLAPIEVSGAGSINEHRVKPTKKIAGENEKEDPEDNTPEARKAQQEEREKDAREAEASKLVAGPRTLLFASRNTDGPRIPVPLLGAKPSQLSLPLAGFSAADRPERNLFATLFSKAGGFTPPGEARQPLQTLAVAPARQDMVAIAKAAVTSSFGATSVAAATAPPAAKVEVVAYSQARPFSGISAAPAADLPRVGGLDTARRAPLEALTKAPAAEIDPLATP